MKRVTLAVLVVAVFSACSSDSVDDTLTGEVVDKTTIVSTTSSTTASSTSTTTATSVATSVDSTEEDSQALNESIATLAQNLGLDYTDELEECIEEAGVNIANENAAFEDEYVFIGLARCAPDQYADLAIERDDPPAGVTVDEFRCTVFESYSFIGSLTPQEFASYSDDFASLEAQIEPIALSNCKISKEQYDAIGDT